VERDRERNERNDYVIKIKTKTKLENEQGRWNPGPERDGFDFDVFLSDAGKWDREEVVFVIGAQYHGYKRLSRVELAR